MTTIREQVEKDTRARANWEEAFLRHPAPPISGFTPRSLAARRGKAKLYHYRPESRRYSRPMIIVPWVGISNTYILDFLPGTSYVEYFTDAGYDVFLVDWGERGEEDRDFGFDDCLVDILPLFIDKARQVTGADAVTLTGICVGGTLTAMYLAMNPDAPVAGHVAIVPLIDTDEAGLFKTWLTGFPAEQMVRVNGMLPASIMYNGFKTLRPLGDNVALLGLAGNLDRPEYINVYKAMNRWGSEFLPMPGRFFVQLARQVYGRNEVLKGEFEVGGEKVDLHRVTAPLLLVSAQRDHIVPRLAARALYDVVASEDKEYLELGGGHISVFAGRSSRNNLWPKLDQWLGARSGALS